MDSRFNQILLEPEQVELLFLIVEAVRNTPSEERQKFFVAQTFGGDFLHHPGIKESENRIYYGDVEELERHLVGMLDELISELSPELVDEA